jgi:tetratricopeptide (TPR) repeat protein
LCVVCCTTREYKLSGDIFVKTGEYEKAVEQYQRWVNRRKNDSEPYVALSVPYYKKNNYMKSAEYLKKAFETDKESAKKAVLFYEKLLEVENYSWSVFYTGAEEFLNEKQFEVAGGLIEEAEDVEDSKCRAKSYVLHGRICIMKGEEDKAFDYLNKAHNLDADNVEAYVYLGEVYASQNKIDNAIASLKEAVSKDPDNFFGHKLLGQSYLKQEKYDMAIEMLEKASSISNNEPTILYDLAYAYLQKEDYTRTSNIAEKILDLPEIESNTKAEAYILLGMSNIYEEKYNEAIKALNKAIDADSNKCDSYQLLAHAYNKAGNLSLSKKFSRKWENCVQK